MELEEYFEEDEERQEMEFLTRADELYEERRDMKLLEMSNDSQRRSTDISRNESTIKLFDDKTPQVSCTF